MCFPNFNQSDERQTEAAGRRSASPPAPARQSAPLLPPACKTSGFFLRPVFLSPSSLCNQMHFHSSSLSGNLSVPHFIAPPPPPTLDLSSVRVCLAQQPQFFSFFFGPYPPSPLPSPAVLGYCLLPLANQASACILKTL